MLAHPLPEVHMTLATTLSRTPQGMNAPLVRVEVDVGSGLPTFSIVGLPETAVRESKDRVRAALANCSFHFPEGRITVSLAPADLPKEGGRFDLPIAIAILMASDQLPGERLDRVELYGELSLGGELQPIRGVLPTAMHATRARHLLVIPAANVDEASLMRGAQIRGAAHFREVCDFARGLTGLSAARAAPALRPPPPQPDLIDVRGQPYARRALEIAAAGEHSLLLIGPPGAGKSMLAQRLPGILPPMSEEEAFEAAAIRSLTGRSHRTDEWGRRSFRAPHHSSSAIALVGGGSVPRPGEISLAHHGVLFLDELPEFSRSALEALREPLETGLIAVSRAARQAEFPARFQLVAAMNPCPCGHLGDPKALCRCTRERIGRYRSRISGPLLDRIDLHIDVPRLPPEVLQRPPDQDTSADVAARVLAARDRQLQRQGCTNSLIPVQALSAHCALDKECMALMQRATKRLALSGRGYHRVLRAARTIADLAGAPSISPRHLAEAIGLRHLDRRGVGETPSI
jgi:magnesium chelatase family protein